MACQAHAAFLCVMQTCTKADLSECVNNLTQKGMILLFICQVTDASSQHLMLLVCLKTTCPIR